MTTTTRFCATHSWCVRHDHSGGELEHYGAETTVPLPIGIDPGIGRGSIMTAQVYCSDQYSQPNVWLGVDQYDEMVLNADQVGELISSLDQLRTALVQMRDHVKGTALPG